jgi:hypothetical protein
MLDTSGQQTPGGRPQQRPVHCEECTIQIGDGYQEAIPFNFVDDSTGTPRQLTVCWRCWESLNRRRLKRLAEASEPSAKLHG